MKNVRLKQMKLRNFKGTRDLTIDFNCKDTNIYGRNETGKTTIVDAFMWIFFNKDSSGASDFDIKTKNSYGEYLHNLEHSVEATLDVDGTETKFMKVYNKNKINSVDQQLQHSLDIQHIILLMMYLRKRKNMIHLLMICLIQNTFKSSLIHSISMKK